MSSSEDYLIEQLKREVVAIREESLRKIGYEPKVCSEMGIVKIAGKRPQSVKELCVIENIADEYAERLLKVVKNFNEPCDMTVVEAESDYCRILKEMSKKLTNLSVSNNMLTARDLGCSRMDISYAGLGQDFFVSSARVTLCDRHAVKSDVEKYDRLINIMREVKSGQRDRGQNELYVGYPYIEGAFPGCTFDIRAPLVLFPVTLYKTANTIEMEVDRSRDPIFNINIALAGNNFFNIDEHIDDNTITDFNGKNIADLILNYFNRYGVGPNSVPSLEPIAFEEREVTSHRYEDADFFIVPYMVLGKFTNNSNSIQRDYEFMVNDDNLPRAVAELAKKSDVKDIFADSMNEVKNVDVSENELFYINQLNSAQENIISAMGKSDAIVIQGPPGTGKSQIITGLIASSVMTGQNVLVISEKETALNVIRSRLGDLSNFVMKVDDSKDKGSFYNQLSRFLDLSLDESMVTLSNACTEIDAQVEKLRRIREIIFTPMPVFDVEPYRLYEMGKKFDLSNRVEYERYMRIGATIPKELTELRYWDLVVVHRDMLDESTIRNYFDYFNMNQTCPWVKAIKPGLSDVQLAGMLRQIDNLNTLKVNVDHASILRRNGARAKYESASRAFTAEFMTDASQLVPMLSSGRLNDLHRMYGIYLSRSMMLSGLDDIYRLYVKAVFDLAEGDTEKASAANDDILRYLIHMHLSDFDAKNSEVHGLELDFDSMLRYIYSRMGDRIGQTHQELSNMLRSSLRGLIGIRNDIEHVIESRNPWSISSFMSHYDLLGSIRIWLMTPGAVSDILPMQKGLFDIVIFDEASQMYAERAIPAIYRGKKVVIAGDHKQLRPTTTIGECRITLDSDPNNIDEIMDASLDIESLLDLGRFSFDSYRLDFHYRSKYEELIAFSNNAFYNGSLYVSPNITVPEEPPIEYHRIDGLWENGMNRPEAEKTVEMISDILKTRKERETIGVITFNAKQAELIEDLLDRKMLDDPEFATLYSKERIRKDDGEDTSMFIKNIETVQGDERDIIIFSLGYGPDSKGTFKLNFGWLNRVGGENRLNVAISRAKKKIHLITSMDPTDIDESKVSNTGPKLLRRYLQYCNAVSNRDDVAVSQILRGLLTEENTSIESRDSDRMIADVCSFLEGKGFKVKTNVGVSGYNLDIAVIGDKGYTIGIEADRSIYPRLVSARERDVHRIKYLRSRGWEICRLWTAEYWKNRDAELARILRAVQAAQ